MLNPTFSKAASDAVRSPYVLDGGLARATLAGNISFDTGFERRLQTVYGDELWLKLDRAGFPSSRFTGLDVLEVCAGTGFLTYHLLQRCHPRSFTVNDISPQEMRASRTLVARVPAATSVAWVLGDMHQASFERQFDLIIGNSFLHHFHNVPRVLGRFAELLRDGGTFISLHEPTPMSTVVESNKALAYPLAVLLPKLLNDIARQRYKGEPSSTDIWMFQPHTLKKLVLNSGFSQIKLISWHFLRPMVVQQLGLHLGKHKPQLAPEEEAALWRAVAADAVLNRLLPSRFFGSVCMICKK